MNKTTKFVDLKRYMGDWYVQAGRFTFLEKQPHNALERYTWNEKEQRIDIEFSYNQGGFDGPLRNIPQKGYIQDHKSNAHWKISPLWPFKFDYLILAISPDYQWVGLGVPSQKYLWIMTRNSQFPKEQLAKVIQEIEATGYPVKDLTIVPHKFN